MSVDLVGDGGRSEEEMTDFEHWFFQEQRLVNPSAAKRFTLLIAMHAWNAALECAAREFEAMKPSAPSVDYAAVCRGFQVPTETQP